MNSPRSKLHLPLLASIQLSHSTCYKGTVRNLRENCSTPRKKKKKVWRNSNQVADPSARVIITEPQAVPVTVLHICQALTRLCFPCAIASASAILISYPVVTFLFLHLKQVPQQFSVLKGEALLVPRSVTWRTQAELSESRSLFPTSPANHWALLKTQFQTFPPLDKSSISERGIFQQGG